MTKTFTIKGHKIRSASNRRFIVVAGREASEAQVPVFDASGALVYETRSYDEVRPVVVRRSDSIDTARKAARKGSGHANGYAVVVDQTTGEVVS